MNKNIYHMDAPTQQDSVATTPLAWPYFSHSAMMMKLEKYHEMYKDDSLWEMSGKHGKIFSEKGRQILESIWNGLFCSSTEFPENMYWENGYLHEFIYTVEEICKTTGMSQCFKSKDEVRERRKLMYDYFLTLQEHDCQKLYQYTSHRSDTLSIKGVIITRLLQNLTGKGVLAEPSLKIDSFIYMEKKGLKNFSDEIQEMIEKDV